MSELAMSTVTVSTPEASVVATPSPTPSKAVAASIPGAAAPASGERPAWLPEKFKTPEDLAKSYGELEKRLGGTPAAAVTPAAAPALALTPAVAPVVSVTAAQLLDAAYAEAENSEAKVITPATYAKLAAAGLDQSSVDRSVAGQRAVVANQKSEVYAAVGGADKYATIAAWAVGGGFTAQEMAAYNSVIKLGNPDIMKVAAAGLAARYAAVNGTEGAVINGIPGSPAVGAATPFVNQTDMAIAINDPRYKRDPAYRASVERRIAVSN